MTAGGDQDALAPLPARPRRFGLVVLAGAVLILLAAAGWGIGERLSPRRHVVELPGGTAVELTVPRVLLGASALLLPVLLGVLLSNRSVRAMARETFTYCLRTKVAWVFGVLLVASLLLLPWAMKGDGTQAGRIRAFLDYSTSATSVLLSLVVVFLSVGVVSDDVGRKHVYIVCTKPLGRWQYILGRWLGVVLLSAVLLGIAAVGIYGFARYLLGRQDPDARPEDRRAVQTEVFAARDRVPADPPKVDPTVAARIGQKKSDGTWKETVEAYKTNYGITATQAEERIVEDMRKDAVKEAQSAAPGASLAWDFSSLRVLGEKISGRGKVTDVGRRVGQVRLEAPPELTGRLVIFGPVWVNGVGGRAVRIWNQGFQAVFHLEDMNSEQMVTLRRGQEVDVVVEPTIQISYKLSPSGGGAAAPLRASWQVENPASGYVYYIPPREALARTRSTLVAPARAISPKGRLRVRFFNHSPYSVTVLSRDVAVLHEVGSFEATFLKTIVLMLMGLMFLAALGVFAGSALSFPVGCLVCFILLWIATTLRFLTEAVNLGLDFPSKGQSMLIYEVGFYLLGLMKVLLPDLASALATSFAVEGLAIPWRYFASTAALTVGVRGLILLALACWIFHRRELARVQV